MTISPLNARAPSLLRRVSGRLVVLIMLGLVLANSALFLFSLSRLAEATDWVTHSLKAQRLTSETLTELVNAETGQRGYIITADNRYLEPYHQALLRLDATLEALRQTVSDNPDQTARMQRVEALVAEKLADLDGILTAFAGRDRAAATALIAEDNGRMVMNALRTALSEMEAEEARLLAERQDVYRLAEYSTYATGGTFVLAALVLLGVIYFFMRRELARRNAAATEIASYADSLDANMRMLERERKLIGMVNEASNFLQSCNSLDEVGKLSGVFLKTLFPNHSGTLSLYAASRNQLVVLGRWGDVSDVEVFLPDDCWALRRGQTHEHEEGGHAPLCEHFGSTAHDDTICVPLVAQGETLGLLSLTRRAAGEGQDIGHVEMVARQLGLTLANMRLRETLNEQSIRDPLTNAFNRRYLEVVANKELALAARFNRSMAVVMLDIDHLKRFNDLHGHAAGDVALVAVADYLQNHIRQGDWMFRYGGEEFVLLLREADREDAEAKIAELIAGIAALPLSHGNQILPRVTVSMGVALHQGAGADLEDLIETADAALYASKTAGRNRATFAEDIKRAEVA
ncbi:diguanylate cyclase [Arsenicitalea aurantiaca]|uniref:diguanylate cyclase n=1 Tax=Arsenicitalea aurantiaca TaxID=1783274 RepID=A0A433XLR9_9HYPH|nr:diguanylate cyclase [Arsenicitalea aurantiaca]RUT34964.1 diguanylate cyclase [Arsenicitalea aurantiaca]